MDAAGWDRRYSTTELIWTAEPNRFLVEEAAGLQSGRALDLGAGEGRNAVWLASQGWQVVAVDFSAAGLEKAADLASRAGVELDLVVADATEELPGPGFDLIVALYLHLPPELRRVAHRNAAAALVPGGTLLVVGHDTTNLTDGVGGPQDPSVLFGPEDVTADVADTGVEIVRAERVLRPVPTDDGPRTAIDALVRARRPT